MYFYKNVFTDVRPSFQMFILFRESTHIRADVRMKFRVDVRMDVRMTIHYHPIHIRTLAFVFLRS